MECFLDDQRVLTSALLGGTVAALLNSIPFLNCLCCLGVMIGGGISVFYFQRTYGDNHLISPALAVNLGLTSGLIAAFLATGIDYAVFNTYGDWLRTLAQDPDMDLSDMPGWWEDILFTFEMQLDAGFPWFSNLIRNLLITPLFCLLGALATRGWLNRKMH
jgi:hypothetical protein